MDPFIWVVSIGIPLLTLSHGALFCVDRYPADIEIIGFQVVSAGHAFFVLVWRCMHPIEFFWIPTLFLCIVSAAWVPLTYRASIKDSKTYCWTGSVWLSPVLYLSACLMLALTPSNSIGDNLCIACAAVCTVCQSVYAHLVHNTIPRVDMSFYRSNLVS